MQSLNLNYCLPELFHYIPIKLGSFLCSSDILSLEKDVGGIPQKFQKSVKKIKKNLKKIFHIYISFFSKRLYALSRLEPRHIFLVTGGKIELSTSPSFIPCRSFSNDQPGMLFSILCAIINHYSIRPSIKQSENCSADGSREFGH